MNPIRLCLIVPTLDRGGAEKQLCLLAAGLPKAQFDVHVIVLTRTGPRQAELDAAGIPVHLIGKSSKYSPSAFFRLVRLLRSLKPDIVHTWIFAANCYGRVAAKWASVPIIIAGERCVDLWKTQRHFMIDRALARFSNCIATNSHGVVDFYVQHGIDAKLFEVIPNGIPPATISPISRQEALSRLNIPEDRRVIGTVGRLWPQKRYRDLICAADLLGVVRPNITLVIVGDGPQQNELLRYRDQVTEANWVRFAGERDDVAQLLPHFEVFWLGSAYEGQSNSLMEAMQAARPIIATDIPGNRDLIEHDVSGMLVPLGKTGEFARLTNQLLDDPTRCAALGHAAESRLREEFSVAKMIERHIALYQKLMSRAIK